MVHDEIEMLEQVNEQNEFSLHKQSLVVNLLLRIMVHDMMDYLENYLKHTEL
jgi:hypothetical protein